jgi:AraC-like DNA-binding protein
MQTMPTPVLPAPFSFAESYEERLGIPPERDGLLNHGGYGRQYPVHHHRELEFNLVTSGTARYFLGDRRYDLARGSLVWLFPAQDHVLLERTAEYRHWVVCFRPEMVAHVCRTEPETPLTKSNPVGWYCRRLAAPAFDHLHETMNGILARRSDTLLFNGGLGYVLRLAWTLFLEAEAMPNGQVLPSYVEQAAALLRSPDGNELSVVQIAERVGVSAPYLSRRFAATVGMTLPAFRNRCRVERFLQNVRYRRDRDETLLEAALAAGFGSYAQCHRIVVEVTGKSPRDLDP